MTIETELDRLCDGTDRVDSASYIDLGAGMVLYCSARLRPAQERLDAMCATAVSLLDGPAGYPAEAVALTATEALVLCRAPGAPGEAVCLVCDPAIPLGTALVAARQALDRAGRP